MTKAAAAVPAVRQDRVRESTRPELNARIDRDTEMRLHFYATAGGDEIDDRIRELEEEPDIEQFLEANAATISVLGLAMGIAFSRKWLLVPALVGGFLFQHAVRGWCPPVPAMRRMGIRTRQEIEREKYALKAIRGDLDELLPGKHR